MDYNTAADIVKKGKQYASADFYRMMFADSIALGLRDRPVQILLDVTNHGSDIAKETLSHALNRGYIVSSFSNQVTFYDVADTKDSTPYFKAHIAMQIAYPELYFEYFEGEQIWDPNHPKMQVLMELCVSCLTNKQHPSDYYGKHEIPIDEPKKRGPMAVTTSKGPAQGYTTWIQACQEYKALLKTAWEIYLQACANKKEIEVKGKIWRDNELDRLREEMSKVSKEYQEGMAQFDKALEDAKNAHTELKLKGKPQRAQFE